MEHFRKKLLARRSELLAGIARAEQDARVASRPEAGDPMDRVIDDAAAEEALQTASADSEILDQVEDALRRLDEGSYGHCVICGKPIEPSRLKAIPWTP